jgi:lipooligosaccharide transport system permease protein
MGEPLFYLITFGIGLGAYIGLIGGKPYLNFLVPGIFISGTVMAATFECLYGTFVRVVHERLYDSLIATPISAEDAIAGDIAWGVFRGMISGTLLLISAVIFGAASLSLLKLILLFALMILVGALFASFSMIITSFAPNFDFFNYYSELVITPMLFFSGVFFPLDSFPGWVKIMAQFLPLTHAVSLSRAVFSGVYHPGLILNLLVIIILEIVAFYLALISMKRRLIK